MDDPYQADFITADDFALSYYDNGMPICFSSLADDSTNISDSDQGNQDMPGQLCFDFGYADTPLFRAAANSTRLHAYILQAVAKGGVIPLKELILRAGLVIIPLGKSVRAIDGWVQYIRKCKQFYTYKVREGRSFIVKIRSRVRIKIHTVGSLYKLKRLFKSTTASRNTILNPQLQNLTFALIQGRKSREGFGRKWCMNDPTWETLKSVHWENCKIEFSPKLLHGAVYSLLQKGIDKTRIIRQYESLLLKWHGIADDKKATRTNKWTPAGLVCELTRRLTDCTLPSDSTWEPWEDKSNMPEIPY